MRIQFRNVSGDCFFGTFPPSSTLNDLSSFLAHQIRVHPTNIRLVDPSRPGFCPTDTAVSSFSSPILLYQLIQPSTINTPIFCPSISFFASLSTTSRPCTATERERYRKYDRNAKTLQKNLK
jgi:hypothetical protein